MGTDLSIKVIQRLESCSSLGIDRGVVFFPLSRHSDGGWLG